MFDPVTAWSFHGLAWSCRGTAVAAAWLGAALAALRLAAWGRAYLALRRLPGPTGSWLLGQLREIVRPDHHRTLSRWAAQYGGIYRMRLAFINVRPPAPAPPPAPRAAADAPRAQAVVVTDPQLIAAVLGKDTEVEKSVAGVYSHFNIVSGPTAGPVPPRSPPSPPSPRA
jgi:hypothetical protein